MKLVKKILNLSKSDKDPKKERTSDQIQVDFNELLQDVNHFPPVEQFRMIIKMNDSLFKSVCSVVENMERNKIHSTLIKNRFYDEFTAMKN